MTEKEKRRYVKSRRRQAACPSDAETKLLTRLRNMLSVAGGFDYSVPMAVLLVMVRELVPEGYASLRVLYSESMPLDEELELVDWEPSEWAGGGAESSPDDERSRIIVAFDPLGVPHVSFRGRCAQAAWMRTAGMS